MSHETKQPPVPWEAGRVYVRRYSGILYNFVSVVDENLSATVWWEGQDKTFPLLHQIFIGTLKPEARNPNVWGLHYEGPRGSSVFPVFVRDWRLIPQEDIGHWIETGEPVPFQTLLDYAHS